MRNDHKNRLLLNRQSNRWAYSIVKRQMFGISHHPFRRFDKALREGGCLDEQGLLACCTGNDTLLGGEGLDTYLFKSGDGWDWIEDSDGKGSIQLNGVMLTPWRISA